MVPYDLKRFYGMSPCLAFPFRKNREHAGLVEDYGKYREDVCLMNGSTDQKKSGGPKHQMCITMIEAIDSYMIVAVGSYHAKFD